MERVAREGALVPHVWPLEVANGLPMAVRRKRIGGADREEAFSTLRRLPIEIQAVQRENDWGIVLGLAARHDLTIYDASYLALAVERKLPLATLDDALIAAARAAGVPVLP
ncbi:MAG: type II toxin-antitoxin system VapC family toxin [Devosia nanyangense]|uniref:Type II toxin-antitoxin system VapC family toxin n=1 Tax=Devosia nanyangense TaxID=1228055 RepID=A0A933L697_9HYPH|nr:type II toxin-antitoxin system VapC family toxin [Devosia nanyangense]